MGLLQTAEIDPFYGAFDHVPLTEVLGQWAIQLDDQLSDAEQGRCFIDKHPLQTVGIVTAGDLFDGVIASVYNGDLTALMSVQVEGGGWYKRMGVAKQSLFAVGNHYVGFTSILVMAEDFVNFHGIAFQDRQAVGS